MGAELARAGRVPAVVPAKQRHGEERRDGEVLSQGEQPVRSYLHQFRQQHRATAITHQHLNYNLGRNVLEELIYRNLLMT